MRPGIVLSDRLKERGWTRDDLAFVIGKNVDFVGRLIRGDQRITARTALLLGAAFREPAAFWLDLETSHRLSQYVPDEERLAAIRERAAKHARGEDITPSRCSACGQIVKSGAISAER
jgi:plasmid maintenance system antidote protein VapI